jgi:hypothetical protein
LHRFALKIIVVATAPCDQQDRDVFVVPAAAAWPKQVFMDATAVKNTIQAIR